MLPETQTRPVTRFDSDPAYDEMASIFAPSADRTPTHVRHLASAPPPDRASRGAVFIVFALVAMLAGLAGLAASRHLATPLATPMRMPTPIPLPAPSRTPLLAAVPKPAPAPAIEPAPPFAPVQLALSRPPSLPPIAARKPLAAAPEPAPQPYATPSRWQKTPHLTGAALQRALAQDVIDTRKLNIDVLGAPAPSSTASPLPRPR